MKNILLMGALSFVGCAIATESLAQATTASRKQASSSGGGIDFAHAKPMPLPVSKLPAVSLQEAVSNPARINQFGLPGVSSGSSEGDGRLNPIQLVPPQQIQPDGAPPPPSI